LHKYTSNFEGCSWKDMVAMDDAALDAKGVSALGARRKMLKIFEVVKAKMGMPTSGNSGNSDGGLSPGGGDDDRSVSPGATSAAESDTQIGQN